MNVPAKAYYGIQTVRASENFRVSGIRPKPEFVKATAMIKLSAAMVNSRLGLLDKKRASAIEKAAKEVMEGRLANEFLVDVYQAGAGTSHNMNVNEVIANRALELLGQKEAITRNSTRMTTSTWRSPQTTCFRRRCASRPLP